MKRRALTKETTHDEYVHSARCREFSKYTYTILPAEDLGSGIGYSSTVVNTIEIIRFELCILAAQDSRKRRRG